MRIVIDMQGAQTESRFRGIGRYSLSLALAIARNRGEHEVLLALSGLFPETIEPIRAAFEGILPQENIRVWHAVGPTRECDPRNADRRVVAEYLREAAIACMQPNVVLVTSLFEGLGDDAVTSVGVLPWDVPTVAVLYDLIPLLSPDIHFQTNPIHIGYYGRKIESLKHCCSLLAISESSRGEALGALDFKPEEVINISSGCDARFKRIDMSAPERQALFQKFGIDKPFLMYTGGADERKNLHRLIKSLALLPRSLRQTHQLVLVGKMPEGNVKAYRETAAQAGVMPSELIFTGYVSDLELMQLYSACRLFVFPSLHEGFGLPPLEAMACGAPVISSNLTSLPEVIGREDALFDPLTEASIAQKIREVLENETFRAELIRYGSEHVKTFSWDRCAERAIEAMSRIARPSFVCNVADGVRETATGIFKPQAKRILVSKLDHMGDLVLAIPAIMKLRARYPEARIDALVGSWNLDAARQLGVFDQVLTLDFFSKKSSVAANARDAALTAVVASMPEYDIAIDLRRQRDTRFILARIPARVRAGYASGDATEDAALAVCLPAESDVPFQTTELNRTPIALQMLRLVDALPQNVNDYIRIPQPVVRKGADAGSVAIFPNAGNDVKEWGTDNFKALIRLLEADPKVGRISVFVTDEKSASPYRGTQSSKLMVRPGLAYAELQAELAGHELCVANNSFGAHLASWLGLKVLAIYSGHETVEEWGPAYGDCHVLSVTMPCRPCHIASRVECGHAFKCLTAISPERVYAAITQFENGQQISSKQVQETLVQWVAARTNDFAQAELQQLAECIARDIPERDHKKLFVDISELVCRDARTGIQRVVRSVLTCLLETGAGAYEVVPVYATMDQPGYRVASQFASQFSGKEDLGQKADEFIAYVAGDVFLGLDLQPVVVPAQRETFKAMRNQGVRVLFVVYDILCVRVPQYFETVPVQAFQQWLSVVAESDGAICISRAVRDDLLEWVKENPVARARQFETGWFHLGADIENSKPTRGIPETAATVFGAMQKRPAFLMVGTLEPRKGHTQTLAAFDELWGAGQDVALVIVGKQGWHVESLAEKLRSHTEAGKRLFWLEGISDEYLDSLYANAKCLILASEGEGFGLPLVEAAQHRLPILARDLPVFREVAGDHASYFSGKTASDLASAITEWIRLNETGLAPQSTGMPWLTWEESTQMLMRELPEWMGPDHAAEKKGNWSALMTQRIRDTSPIMSLLTK